MTFRIIIYSVLLLILSTCGGKTRDPLDFFAGENHAVCIISYESNELSSAQIIDSLIILNPVLGERNQNKYTYNSDETGYVREELYFWHNEEHYVLSLEPRTNGNKQSLKIVSFGVDGEILEKTDGMSSHQIELANEIVNSSLISELKKHFPGEVFIVECME